VKCENDCRKGQHFSHFVLLFSNIASVS